MESNKKNSASAASHQTAQKPASEVMRLLNLLPHCVIIFDLVNLRLRYVNDYGARMFGYEPGEKEAGGGLWQVDLYGENSQDRVLQHFELVKALQDGESAEFTCRCRGKSEPPVTVKFVSTILTRNEQGQALESVAVGSLAEVPAEGLVQATPKLYQESGAVLWEYDFSGLGFGAIYGGLEEMTGIPEATLKQTANPLKFVWPEDQPMVASLLLSAIALRHPFEIEMRVRRDSNHMVWVRLTGAWRSSQIVAGTLVDITRRVQYREELQRSAMEGRLYGARVSQALEEQKRRHAQFLHDEVGQLATRVLMDTDWLMERAVPAGTTDADEIKVNRLDLEELRKNALSLLDAIRGRSHELLPSVLEEGHLIEALEWLARLHERKAGIRCTVQCSSGPNVAKLSKESMVGLFRIAQESLTNVWKHAKASWIQIKLEDRIEGIELRVRDNGIGMILKDGQEVSQMGLRSMRERARLMGGTFQIRSNPGEGTEIAVYLPAEGLTSVFEAQNLLQR